MYSFENVQKMIMKIESYEEEVSLLKERLAILEL
jgi:hypothetical protein